MFSCMLYVAQCAFKEFHVYLWQLIVQIYSTKNLAPYYFMRYMFVRSSAEYFEGMY